MNTPSSWSTYWSVSFNKSCQIYLLFLSPLKMNEVCILLRYWKEWFSIFKLWLPAHPQYQRSGNLGHHMHCILRSFSVFGMEAMHWTVSHWIQYLCTMLFHRSNNLWTFRCTWTLLYHLIIPVIEWMESWHWCDLKFESISHIDCNMAAHTAFSLVSMGLFKNPKNPSTVWELAVAWWLHSGYDGIIWNKVGIASVLRLINACIWIILGEIQFPGCNIFTSLQFVQFVISLMTHLNVLAI